MHPQNDPVTVMVQLLAIWLSPAISASLGPYAVIFLAATAGASWSLGRREPATKLRGIWFFFRVTMTACVLTMSVAAGVQKFYSSVTAEWSVVPIAFVIGLIGDDWAKVRVGVVEAIRRWLTRPAT